MKIRNITAFVGIAAMVLATAAPGFAQQGGASCSQEIAQARAHIWRAQAAMDIARIPGTTEPASGAGRALASSPALPQGQASGAGRIPGTDQPASGAGRVPGTDQPASGAGRIPGTDQPASGAGRKALASSPALPQGQASGAGRIPGTDQPASGAGRVPGTDQPASGAGRIPGTDQPASGSGRALAAAPGFTPSTGPASAAGRVSSMANAQFRVLASDQDRKAFVETLNDQERKVLYQSLSAQDRKRLASAMSEQELKDLSQKVSSEDSKAWAEKVASDRAALNQKIQKARALARAAQDLCKKGDSAGATAKAKDTIEALK